MVKKKLPATKIDRLKIKEKKLRRELNETLEEISKDTKKRDEEHYLDVVERQKLANRSIDIRSQLLRLQDEIGTRTYIKEDKDSKDIRKRIEERYAAAAKRHNKLLWATVELQRLKEDEKAIRAIANDDLGLETRQSKPISPIDDRTVEEREISSAKSRISASSLRHSTQELDLRAIEKQEHLEDVRQSLSSLGLNSPREQLHKADGLKHKYELTREMRNLNHGQMIARSNKNSYWRINRPYRRDAKSIVRVRRAYTKDVYEEKIDIMKAREMNIFSSRTERFPEEKSKTEREMGRYKMASGRTISVNKMKDFTPPGITLLPNKDDKQP